jgi:hypothetical protein
MKQPITYQDFSNVVLTLEKIKKDKIETARLEFLITYLATKSTYKILGYTTFNSLPVEFRKYVNEAWFESTDELGFLKSFIIKKKVYIS